MLKYTIDKYYDESLCDSIACLVQSAFAEREKTGTHTSCSRVMPSELKNNMKDGFWVLAYETVSHILVGSCLVHCRIDAKSKKYAYVEYWAVDPDYSGKGIGAAIMKKAIEYARQENCIYVISDTSVKWKSSIHAHQKLGFKIVAYQSYPNTNYYSYIFRLIIDGRRNIFKDLALFGFTFLKTKLLKTEDGNISHFSECLKLNKK